MNTWEKIFADSDRLIAEASLIRIRGGATDDEVTPSENGNADVVEPANKIEHRVARVSETEDEGLQEFFEHSRGRPQQHMIPTIVYGPVNRPGREVEIVGEDTSLAHATDPGYRGRGRGTAQRTAQSVRSHDTSTPVPETELTWMLTRPDDEIRMILFALGLSTAGSRNTRRDRLNRYHKRALGVPDIPWDRKKDEISHNVDVRASNLTDAEIRRYLLSQQVNPAGSSEVIQDRFRRLLRREDGDYDAPWSLWKDELVPVGPGTPEIPDGMDAYVTGATFVQALHMLEEKMERGQQRLYEMIGRLSVSDHIRASSPHGGPTVPAALPELSVIPTVTTTASSALNTRPATAQGTRVHDPLTNPLAPHSDGGSNDQRRPNTRSGVPFNPTPARVQFNTPKNSQDRRDSDRQHRSSSSETESDDSYTSSSSEYHSQRSGGNDSACIWKRQITSSDLLIITSVFRKPTK